MIALLHRSLISDVLDLSKIEAGRMEIETIPFDIREEVTAYYLFEEKVHQKRLEVSALVHDCVPACTDGDPGRFGRFLLTLLERSQGMFWLSSPSMSPSNGH